MDHRPPGASRRTLLGCLLIVVGLVACSGVTGFTLDRLCLNSLTNRLPIYPNAEIRVRRHNMFTEFGMGTTYMELYSSDDSQTVTGWYGRTTGDYRRDVIIEGKDPASGFARAQWSVVRAEDGTGSFIQLAGNCVG